MERVRRVLGSQVTAVCLVVFLGDVATGFVSPTFSLFAEGLGVSVALIGVISTLGGLTSLVIAIPIGSYSDKVSRPRIMQIGMLAFALGSLVLALAGGAPVLILGRVVLALGMVMVFRIAAAHLGDITPPGGRSLAFGAYATALGLGFTTGSLLGGQLGERIGIGNAYFVSAAIAFAGTILAVLFIHDRDVEGREHRRQRKFLPGLRCVAGSRQLQVVSLGNLLVAVTFTGAITTFFPLHGERLGFSAGLIGTMFAIRGLVSTLGRVPNGIVARILGNQAVMLSALAIEIVVMLGITLTEDRDLLILFLAIEGLAFGGYLVASQTFIADTFDSDVRGAAIGFNTTASGVGATLAPFALGLVADQWGVATVFPVTAGVVAAGTLAIAYATLFAAESGAPDTETIRSS